MAGYYVWHKEGVPFRVQFRTRVENEDALFFRNRLKMAFRIKEAIKPYSSFEVFSQENNNKPVNLYRYEGGVKLELHDNYNITLMYRHEINIWEDDLTNKSQALGLMINYAIRPKE